MSRIFALRVVRGRARGLRAHSVPEGRSPSYRLGRHQSYPRARRCPPRALELPAVDGREPTDGVTASVLVPVLNEEEHIREAVAAMRGQELDGEIELLFMDGGSTDRTRAILEELAA